jgi:hypothetical protein
VDKRGKNRVIRLNNRRGKGLFSLSWGKSGIKKKNIPVLWIP